MTTAPVTYWAEWARLPTGVTAGVRITVDGARITAVTVAPAEPGDQRRRGLTLPGFANTHSHAFHRALRGRTHDGGGTFWTWRDRMYAVAARLDPDRYLDLARAVYAEMALAGVSAVGEFHYLHHQAGGRPYADPNAMGAALVEAAAQAGIRLTLLDACYLAGGLGPDGPRPLAPEQRRFGDADAAAWADRVARREEAGWGATVTLGVAGHSVRAVPRAALPVVVAAGKGRPLHVHLSEQPAENEQCRQAYGCSPTELLAAAGALGPDTTAVHATHLGPDDIAALGRARCAISVCPTTERDLADGIGPTAALHAAGARLTLGSDQHAVIDLLEEARALELDERLASGRRGTFTPAQLLDALTVDGHAALGRTDAGRLAVGARADLTTVALDSVRTAGIAPEQVAFAAGAADVYGVVVDGVEVVRDGGHRLGDVGRLLAEAIAPLWAP